MKRRRNFDLLKDVFVKLRDTVYEIEDFIDLQDFRKDNVKEFLLCDGVVWPGPVNIYVYGWYYVVIDNRIYDLFEELDELVEKILFKTRNKSQEVSRVLQRVQSAIDWCKVKLEKYKREAQEILQQQAKELEELKAEIVFRKLLE